MYTFLDEKVLFFHENFAERLFFLLNCPKGRYVTKRPSVRESWVGNDGQKAIKEIIYL